MRLRTLGMLLALVLAGLGTWILVPGMGQAGAATPTFYTWGKPGRKRPSTFDRPRCVAVAPDDTLWVLDLTGRIQHFTPEGKYLGEMHMPDVKVGRPQGIDVDKDGCVYVADTHYNQVVKFDQHGKIVLRFGEQGLAPGKFFWPCSIAVAPDGTIYTGEYAGVTETGYHDRIQKWSPQGHYIAHWGRFGEAPGEFMRPAGLDVGPDGNLYVVDAANHRIQVFTPEGEFLRLWGGQGTDKGKLYYPYDLTIDRWGRVYVVEYGASRLQCFSAQGVLLATWGSLHRGGEGLFQPWGVAVSASGTVYIADTFNYRVVRAPLHLPANDLAACRH